LTKKTIKFGIWKGLDIGCKCLENDKIEIYDKKCSEVQLRINCENILPRSAQIFEKYRGHYFYKTWPFNNETYGYILSNNSNNYKLLNIMKNAHNITKMNVEN